MSSSELPHILHQYQRYLHRIDALEQRLEETITVKRQRAAALLEIVPTHRSSHLRVFVTHHVDEETSTTMTTLRESSANNASIIRKRKWTLVLEGRLLVGYLDHENAFLADQESSSSITSSTTVLIPSSTSGNTLSTGVVGVAAASVQSGATIASSNNNNNSSINLNTNTSTTLSENTISGNVGGVSSRLSRDFNRGFCDIDFDDPPPMIKFTHFFDKVSVSVQSFHRSSPTKGGKQGGGSGDDGIAVLSEVKMKRALKELSTSSSSSKRKSIMNGDNKGDSYTTSGNITTLSWDRDSSNPTTLSITNSNLTPASDDSHAFHIVYDDLSQDRDTVQVVTIQLYRRAGSVEMYKPSEALAALLFPHSLAEDERKKKLIAALTNSTKVNASGDDFISPKKKGRSTMKNDNSNNVVQSSLDGRLDSGSHYYGGVETKSVPKYSSLPFDNDVYIPLLVSMDDILGALLCYVKDRDLIDKIDPNMISNNAALFNLFECNVISLATMKGLLLSRKLVEKVGVMDYPIVLTYLMRKDGSVSRVNDDIHESTMASVGAKDETLDVATGSPDTSSSTKNETISKSIVENDTVSKSIVGLYPNFLTFDMDVEVPTLFAYRTREILGRIKRREFEWTNARTKALRMVQASKVEEDLIKEKLEDIVKGRGLSKDHIPILLALARTSSGGSQAQICAHIDARTAFLMQRLEHHTSLAEVCWDTVEGLRNR